MDSPVGVSTTRCRRGEGEVESGTGSGQEGRGVEEIALDSRSTCFRSPGPLLPPGYVTGDGKGRVPVFGLRALR